MKKITLFVFFSFLFQVGISQASNNNCANAIDICDSQAKTGTTAGSNASVCPTCSDGATIVGSACFDMHKTVWFKFTTNAAGGNAIIALSNITCTVGLNGISGVVYRATTPCNSSTYTAVSNCVANSTANFGLAAAGLLPNTTYYVLIGSDDVSECGFDIEITGPAVAVTNTLVISSNVGTTIICPEDVVTFNANTPNCTNPRVDWFVDGGFVTTTTNGDPFRKDYFVDGQTVTAVLKCDCGQFVNSNPLILNVHPYINVDAGPYTNIPFGASTRLNGTGGVTYSWAPSETLDNPNVANPLATPLSTTTYFMTATSPEGCNFYSEVIVNVLDSVFIPNIFSPNGDGVNDLWEIPLIDLYPKAEITVFDRWGQIVFKTIGYPRSARWDGTFNGKPLPASTYYYTVSLSIDSEEERVRTGYVTIIY